MSIARDILKRELIAQEEKLTAVIDENQKTIDAGRRAAEIVAAQQRHVDEIRRGVEQLEQAERDGQVEA